MLDVARDMERICPDAWLIQSGNPVFEGCTLMTRETGIKVCGLCHGHYGYLEIARVLGLDPARVTWQAPGLNHNIWLTHFLYDGKDAYPLLDEWIADAGARSTGARTWPSARTTSRCRAATIHQYQLFGLMPIGDTPRQARAGGITPTSRPRSTGSASRGAARTPSWRGRSTSPTSSSAWPR